MIDNKVIVGGLIM